MYTYIPTYEEKDENINILHIESNNFKMYIILDHFFPASQKNIKTLIEKNILECDNSKELLYQIVTFLKNAVHDIKYYGYGTVIEKQKLKYEKNLSYINRKYIGGAEK